MNIAYRIYRFTVFCFVAMLVCSCINLEPYPNGELTEEETWLYPKRVQGMIAQMYTGIPKNYDNIEGAYLDCATDNAVSTDETRDITKFALNRVSPSEDPFLQFWNRNYNQIKLANTFLEDNRGFNMRYLLDNQLDSLLRYRLQGEAYGLRAWFYWDLLQKFGGKGVNGQMLGVPLITKVISKAETAQLSRNSYDECVMQIINDLDSAYKYLPIAYRNFLLENPSKEIAYGGGQYWGRIDGITTRAIKSLVYLSWASPRFNPANDVSRWDSAAVYAKQVIDFKLTVDSKNNTQNPQRAQAFDPVNGINWVLPNFSGCVWVSQYTPNDKMERMFYPGSFMGYGTMGATQELVDAFPMANGYPTADPRSGYNPEEPYKNRDPRFYSAIFYGNSQAVNSTTEQPMHTFETWEGGIDAPFVNTTNSKTGYYVKKFIYMGLDFTAATKDIQRHAKFLIEWSHMLLAFAEASNQVVGPNDMSKYGLSAKQAAAYLRTRQTSDNTNGLPASDPYLNEMATAKDTFNEFLKDERRITTCFEGQRFYDLRRWTTTLDDLNKPVHGIKLTKKNDGNFLYEKRLIEERKFNSAYLPIPYDEILRMPNLIQNEGWDTWR